MEDRLEAVYTGNAYNRTPQMGAAYDGDGNRVYQVNYNPEKDEDPSGNDPILPVLGPILPPIPVPSGNTNTKGITWDLIQQVGNAIWNQVQPAVGTISSFHKGATGSIMKGFFDKPLVSLMPLAQILEKRYHILFGSNEDSMLSDLLISGSG